MDNIFYIISISLSAMATSFFVPVVWRRNNPYIAVSLGVVFIFSVAALYGIWGTSIKLDTYYNVEYMAQRKAHAQVRPLYAQIQAVKLANRLNLPFELKHLDLVLHYASLQSQDNQGILAADTIGLLESLLQAAPQQITALNLLAVHAYKSQQYPQAVDYWQKILEQFPASLKNSEAEKILKKKIAHAQKFCYH